MNAYIVFCNELNLVLSDYHVLIFFILAATAGSRLPIVRMKDRIFAHAPRGLVDLSAVLASNLSYKIAVKTMKFVESHSDTFELGDCEYGVAVDSLLEHILVGNVGSSEMITVSRNANFLTIFDNCCGYTVYRDQVDPSSIVLKRPDDTIVAAGSVCLKNEAKGKPSDAHVARKELTDKLSPGALKVFPANSQSIFGMTTFPNLINIYSIGFDLTTNNFFTTFLCAFDMRQLDDRVLFVKAVFKIAEWMSTVPGPHDEFHLLPDVRRETPNGHHITWTKECLLKELKLYSPTIAEEETNMRHTMSCIAHIYGERMPNVEWGTVEHPNFLKITRIGSMLKRAILSKMITREKALADVRKGENVVHFTWHFAFLVCQYGAASV